MKIKELTTPLDKKTTELLKAGDLVHLSGTILTARDAAHKRLLSLLEEGKPLPVNLEEAVIYYAGPTPPRPGCIIGSAGPTTSSRMDRYTPALLEKTGFSAMIGKGNRSPEVTEAIKNHNSIYFTATGGAGALISTCIQSSEIICYEDLGPEAIYKLKVKNFPLIVAIDTLGNNLYTDGPEEYRQVYQ
ncbi:fumarate hydratase subunit beta [Chitinispirillum alkaliphilum]|nr:fumarate hydratase subunit beta [Chitinispirillum alkaliphilum]